MTAQSLSEPDLQTMPSSQQPILSAEDLSVTYLSNHQHVRAMADANTVHLDLVCTTKIILL